MVTKKILVTGSSGYLGRTVCEALKEKYELIALTRDIADLRDFSKLKKFFDGKYFDAIVHCSINGANRFNSSKHDWNVLDNNLLSFYNLLTFRNHYDKFINFGSGAELYLNQEPYGMSKMVIANSIKTKSNFYNLRIFGVFDQNEAETRFIKSNVIRYINRQSMIINKNKFMDFIYTKDLITLLDRYLTDSELTNDIDCVYQEKYTLLDIANKINSLSNYKVPITFINEGMDSSYIGDYQTIDNIEFDGLDLGIFKTYESLLYLA